MQIILTILFWILIILLAVIGLIITIFLIALFLPIKYNIFLKSDLHYEIEVKVLGRTVYPWGGLRSKRPKHSQKRRKKRKKATVTKKEELEQELKEEVSKPVITEEEINQEVEEESQEPEEKKDKEQSKILNFIKNTWQLIEEYDFETLIKPTKRLIFKIVKRLKPEKFNIEAEIGIDPYKTGLLMAFISQFHFEDNIQIIGNYEEKKLEGFVEVSGKLRLAYFTGPALIFILSKPILKFLLYRRRKKKERKKYERT